VDSKRGSHTRQRLISLRTGCGFSFSSEGLAISLEKPGAGDPPSDKELQEFTDQADILSRIVIDQLGLKEFVRVGFRVWYLFACDTKEEAEKWIRNLGYYSIASDLNKAFDGAVEITNATVIIGATDRKFRIALNGVENQAQLDMGEEILNVRAANLSKDQDKLLKEQMRVKRRLTVNPGFAAMIDVDAFQDSPISIDPRDFIQTSIAKIEQALQVKMSH
jgi:hypothetical protein